MSLEVSGGLFSKRICFGRKIVPLKVTEIYVSDHFVDLRLSSVFAVSYGVIQFHILCVVLTKYDKMAKIFGRF